MAVLLKPIPLVVAAGVLSAVLTVGAATQKEICVVEFQRTILRLRPEMLDVIALVYRQRNLPAAVHALPCLLRKQTADGRTSLWLLQIAILWSDSVTALLQFPKTQFRWLGAPLLSLSCLGLKQPIPFGTPQRNTGGFPLDSFGEFLQYMFSFFQFSLNPPNHQTCRTVHWHQHRVQCFREFP